MSQAEWERKLNSASCGRAQDLILRLNVKRWSSVEFISILLPSVKEKRVWKAGEGYLGLAIVYLPHCPTHTPDKDMTTM